MRTFILTFFTTFSLLNAGLPAKASPLQQPQNTIAQGPLTKIMAYPAVVKDSSVNNAKDSSFIIVRDTSFMQINTKLKIAATRLKQKTTGLEEYVTEKGFNTDYCFMVDMSIPSGKRRFFVYNIKKDSVELRSLVSHGSGSYKPDCNDQLTFSNLPNSFATSIGRYKIGDPYYGTYGLSYKLYGLDSTNSNAFERAIVLHSDSYVPEIETYPRHIYESAGCPIVSPTFLEVLGKYIKPSSKPILLWIYN
jgi:hypothetical protein